MECRTTCSEWAASPCTKPHNPSQGIVSLSFGQSRTFELRRNWPEAFGVSAVMVIFQPSGMKVLKPREMRLGVRVLGAVRIAP